MNEESNFSDPKFLEVMDKIVAMFFEFGIRNLNMDDISRNLGISKKTLYQYFKSKEDLIEKLLYYDHMKWDIEMSKLKIDDMNAIEILLQVSLKVFDEIERFNPKLKFELKKYYEPQLQQFLIRKHNHIFGQISKNMEKGIKEGIYRSDVNIELVASLYLRNLVMMHDTDYCLIEKASFKEIFKVMFENHIRAISTPEGIAYLEKRKSEISQSNKNIFHQ